MFDFIAFPLGKFLLFIYENLAFHRYGVAIIIFTVLIRVILLPLTVKQYTSMSKMQEVQPQLQEIQKIYKNDKAKLNEEIMKIYQENKINPAGGCLPLLIQMPILFSLYYVIYNPLKYMLKVGAPDSKVFLANEITSKLASLQGNARIQPAIDLLYKEASNAAKALNIPVTGANHDVFIINFFSTHKTSLTNVGDILNMNFLNLNLGLIPKWNLVEVFNGGTQLQYIPLLIIPILAIVTTFISIKYSMSQQQNSSSNGNEMSASMNKSMSLMMPIMTGFMSFSVPAGLGLYWIINNVVQILQQMFMNKFVLKKKKEVVGS